MHSENPVHIPVYMMNNSIPVSDRCVSYAQAAVTHIFYSTKHGGF